MCDGAMVQSLRWVTWVHQQSASSSRCWHGNEAIMRQNYCSFLSSSRRHCLGDNTFSNCALSVNDSSMNWPCHRETLHSVSVQPQSALSFTSHLLYTILRSLHSRKLHILGFRARTVCTSSLVIFFFSLSDRGTYHFWSLSLPCRLKRSMNCICNKEKRETREEAVRQDETEEGWFRKDTHKKNPHRITSL